MVFACHSDQASSILEDASGSEREILSAIRYRANDVVLHTDTSVLPRRRGAWGAWNYRIPRGKPEAPRVTYDMNVLQGLESRSTFCISLNATDEINQDSILFRDGYSHPQYSLEGFAAQQRHAEISGRDRTHFCGAYWGNGFHEDGVRSAVRVAEYFGVSF